MNRLPKFFTLLLLSLYFSFFAPLAKAGEYRFHTPSRNIYCLMTLDYISCQVLKHSWKNWGCSDGGCYGNRFTLPAHAPAYARLSSDSMAGFTTNILDYGRRAVKGSFFCDSHPIGITCKNGRGDKMHLNRDFYELK
jgi:hypothetical protein